MVEEKHGRDGHGSGYHPSVDLVPRQERPAEKSTETLKAQANSLSSRLLEAAKKGKIEEILACRDEATVLAGRFLIKATNRGDEKSREMDIQNYQNALNIAKRSEVLKGATLMALAGILENDQDTLRTVIANAA